MPTRVSTSKPKPNLSAIAREHGVHRSTVQAWHKEGVDLSDTEAIKARVAIAKGKEPETLADLKKRKLRLEAERLETILAREKVDLVPMAEVERWIVVWTATFKAALKYLCGNFPGEAEGLDAPAMQKLLVLRTDEILTMISERKFTPKPYGKAATFKP
jgi:transposase-like protein